MNTGNQTDCKRCDQNKIYKENIHGSGSRRGTAGVRVGTVVSHVVEEEGADVGEEVLVGEDVDAIGIREGVRDEASSRADSAPQKPYRPSPVQDSKQRGLGGLLSRLAMHVARRDGEEWSSSARLWNWRQSLQ